jgi:hypothetical protein
MSITEKVKAAVTKAYQAWQGVSSSFQPHRGLFEEDTSATVLMCAAKRRLGPEFLAYEPETLWLELDPTPLNRDKLMAGIALATYPSFYWDYSVFGHTVLALNDEAVFPESLPKPTLEQLVWGVFEAELILALTEDGPITPEFGDDIAAYVAACLHAQGVIYTPENLRFAQPYLDKLISKEAKELQAKVKDLWAPLASRTAFEDVTPEDDAAGVQLTHLVRAQLYFVKRADALTSAL